MDMESIFGKTRRKIQAISLEDTPPLTTRSDRDITLAMRRIKVKTKRFIMKAGIISERTPRFMMDENMKESCPLFFILSFEINTIFFRVKFLLRAAQSAARNKRLWKIF
jgi:hypothetical protein